MLSRRSDPFNLVNIQNITVDLVVMCDAGLLAGLVILARAPLLHMMLGIAYTNGRWAV